jgi:HEAT repeat protein
MDKLSPNPTIQPAAGKPARRWFVALAALLIAIWVIAMLFRWELRARWWAWHITRAESREDRDFYLTRLASIRDKSLGVVDMLLEDPRPEVREAGITVLRYCESEGAADRLLTMLGDEVPDVAGMAATALAWRAGSSRYVDRLQTTLNRKGPPQWGAAVALGRIGGPSAENALKSALGGGATGDWPADVRAQIIDSLGMLGCRDSLGLIAEALKDDRLIQTLPHSQLSARRAIAALQPDLRTRGMDPADAMAAADSAPSVAAVAARWLRLLAADNSAPTTHTASHPAN